VGRPEAGCIARKGGSNLRMERIPYFGKTLIRWQVGGSTFLALPEKGARLMNWNLAMGDGSVRDVIHWPEIASLEEFTKARGGNPILFPFCARTFDRGETGFWRDARGIRRPMPMHGFARQGEFRATRVDGSGFEAVFLPGDEAKASYPFEYEFRVLYRFSPFGLTCNLILENLGDEPLPWCAGHHFYFKLPWSEGSRRGDYLIRIPSGATLRQDSSGQLVPGPRLGQDEPMDNPALIDTFHTSLRASDAVFGEKGHPGDVTVRLGSEAIPPTGSTFVTWTQADDSPFYCVEPWMGPANAAEHKKGLHLVPPGGRDTFTVGVSVG
jgi:galactose mutarotase-like enzyme